MNNYGYNPPKDSMVKIDIKASINSDLKQQNNNFEKYKKYISQQSTDTNYEKTKPRGSKTVKVTSWSIKIKWNLVRNLLNNLQRSLE